VNKMTQEGSGERWRSQLFFNLSYVSLVHQLIETGGFCFVSDMPSVGGPLFRANSIVQIRDVC
jgi:hypothetical protein